jgi:pimeloyl-CoA synthetase
MNNIKYGNNQEIDILATKVRLNEVIHIEVTCSSNALKSLGAKDYSGKKYESCANAYLEKKFLNDKVVKKIQDITSDTVEIKRWFIHADLKEPKQLDVFRRKGIETKHINDVIKDIKEQDLKEFIGDKRIKQLFDILDRKGT